MASSVILSHPSLLLSHPRPSFLRYGPTEGSAAFRHSTAAFLSRSFEDHPASPSSLFQTSGATHGLNLALQVFFSRQQRKIAFVEDPCYFLAPGMLHEQGFDIVPVRHARGEGMDLEALEAAVCTARASGQLGDASKFAGVVYVVPSHQNPTGGVMPGERT